ncbi:putative mucin/carbohydrate-binding domain-containing protein [Erwinia mallotivora]|uniref:putative mucin/carbohydrate-binding domain-containing protein n=1 Tax=Erwinia mallotivora TaxID=69222 RepID=UPI0021BE2DAE|nr:putative mucin/carbohydrate-binding domain-containing protein [Erwinia mallotivora]
MNKKRVTLHHTGQTASTHFPLYNQIFFLRGSEEKIFSSVTIDFKKMLICIEVTDQEPHSLFSGETYAEISIFNSSGSEVFRKTIHGTKTALSYDEIPFTTDSRIEIFHQQPGRQNITPEFADLISDENKHITLNITASGLKNNQMSNIPQNTLIAWIDKTAGALLQNPAQQESQYASVRDAILLAITSLPDRLVSLYWAKYFMCLPDYIRQAVEPEIPDVPDEPEIPDVPDEPEIPDVPDEPEIPDVPDEASVPAWNSQKVYSTHGELVLYKGKVYRQNFYSVNMPPDVNSAPWGQPWIYLYDYNIPDLTPDPIHPVPDVDPVVPDAPFPVWQSQKIYSTHGEQVSWKRKVYRQNFYSVNMPPDLHSAPWGQPWIYLYDY